MSDPNLDIVQSTSDIVTYQECASAEDTLAIIEWEPDGRMQEQIGFDNTPFSIEVDVP